MSDGKDKEMRGLFSGNVKCSAGYSSFLQAQKMSRNQSLTRAMLLKVGSPVQRDHCHLRAD